MRFPAGRGHQQAAAAAGGERGGKVNGRRRLSDAAFLVRYGDPNHFFRRPFANTLDFAFLGGTCLGSRTVPVKIPASGSVTLGWTENQVPMPCGLPQVH